MNALWHRYVQMPFQRALAEVPWFGPVISALLVTMVVDLLTQALTNWGGLWLGWIVVILLTVATLTFVYAYTVSESRRHGRGLGPIGDRPNPPPAHGLIFLFSREDTLREAVDYHRSALVHCWLLVTPEMRERAARAAAELSDLSFTLHPLRDRYDSQGCYRTVLHIYREEAPRLGLAAREVVADITGGTKPMTLGMIVACLEGDYPIEHVPTAFEADRPTGPLPPIQIVVKSSSRPDRLEE